MSSKHKMLKGGIIGAIIGLVAGLLFAPRSGKETRKIIKSKAEQAAESAEKELKKLHGDLDDVLKKSKVEINKLEGKAKKDYEVLRAKAEAAQVKVKELIAIVRDGDYTQEELDRIIKNAQKAKDALKKYSK